jgi:hypothetical protein
VNLSKAREALYYCNSFNRVPTLIELSWIDPEAWLAVLGEQWEVCDNIGFHQDALVDGTPLNDVLFDPEYAASVRHLIMSEAENEAYAALPDKVTIYRGCYAANKWGLSWSLDRDTAAGLPLLHRYRQDGQPLLVKAIADKSRIAFLKLGRGESEVVTYRPRHVSTSHIRRAALKVAA